MIESTNNTQTQSEQFEHALPDAIDTNHSHLRILVMAHWLQHKLSQIISQLHLLTITRGRSLRWRRICMQLVQVGAVLLLIVGAVPLSAMAASLSARVPPEAAYTINMPSSSTNPLASVDVGQFSAPSFADLDGDGDLDAYVGERYGTIYYYKNTGSATSPAFTWITGSLNPLSSVDVGDYSTPSFADLDGDGDLDAYVGEKYGNINFYKNTSSATSPVFSEQTGTLNPLNGVEVPSGFSTPSFADVDGDGDLDAIIGADNGLVHFYQNNGTATSPVFNELTGSLNPFGGFYVGGACTPTFADLDEDGDLDFFNGNSSGIIKYFENTGSAISPAFIERGGSLNPFNSVNVEMYSNPHFADLEADGDLDLFIGEGGGTIQYVENTSLACQATFFERTGSLNPFISIDVERSSAPGFADLDGDGDLDAYSGNFHGEILYMENSGSAINPAFSLVTGSASPFDGLTATSVSFARFVDLDGDGDLDGFVGNYYGVILYFENTGSATNPAFIERSGSTNPLNGVDLNSWNIPSFADLDGDGDLDVFIGDWKGNILFMRNTGNATSPAFVAQSGSLNPLDGAHAGYVDIISFADLDGDGDLDAFIGGYSGHIYYYENTGNATSPAFVERDGVLNPFLRVDVGYEAAPAFADLDSDGDLDAVSGELDGAILYFENVCPAAKVYLPLAIR